jgi:tRNA (guanine-N7-)-methyltransferase
LIEFKRKFYKDDDLPFLWHYMLEIDSISQKPVSITEPQIFQPLSLETLFEGRNAEKLVLEIGSGKGIFLSQYAQKFPQNCILGTEWDLLCANLTAKKLKKLGLKNAAVMRGDLFYFLKDLTPSNSIDEVHIYFPDPWPKRRQQKNRLILREGFLQHIYRVLKPGQRYFYWATDHEKYNALALKAFRNFPYAKILEENTAQPTTGIETGFEKKYKKEGRKIYRSVIELRVEECYTNTAG